eukprot:gene22316-26766_t
MENTIDTSSMNDTAVTNVSSSLLSEAETAAITQAAQVALAEPRNPIIEAMHDFNDGIINAVNDFSIASGLPWWACIAVATVGLRFVILPFTIKTQKNTVTMQKVRQEVEKMSHLNDGTMEGRMKLAQVQQVESAKHGVSPLSMLGLGLAQAPFYIYFFVLVKTACEDFPHFVKNGGALWFQDLSVADPFYVLPVVSSAMQLASIHLTFTEETPLVMKIIFSGLCVLPLYFTLSFSAGLNVYWCINSLLFVIQNYLFRQEAVKRFFGIPILVPAVKSASIKMAPPIRPSATITEQITKKDLLEKARRLEKLKQEKEELEKSSTLDKIFPRRRK